MPPNRYMWASVQTVRGCPKHCSFCSVWKTDGQRPRQRVGDGVIAEIVELRRRGFRFIALADDNFYPVTLTDLAMAQRRADKTQFQTLSTLRAERFELMAPPRAAARRHGVLHADHDGSGRGSRVPRRDETRAHQGRAGRRRIGHARGTQGRPQGLQRRWRGRWSTACARSSTTASTCSARSSSGCRAIAPRTFDATVAVAQRAGVTFAQFVMLTPFPGTTDFAAWEQTMATDPTRIAGHAADAPLAHSAGAAAEGLHAASDDVGRRHPARHAGRVGPLLQPSATSGSARAASSRSSRGWRSC